MSVTTYTDLELLYYGQQGWGNTIGENAVKLAAIFATFDITEVDPPEISSLMWDTVTSKWVVGPIKETSLGLTDGASISVDAASHTMFTVTLGGNRTLDNPTNLVDGKKYFFYITQDATGSRLLTWGSNYYFPGGTCTLSTTGSKTDMIRAVNIGGILFCTIVNGFDDL